MPQYTLRSYQQEAVNVAMQWLLKNSDPALLSISGGGGKSLICAELARLLYEKTGKRVLCLVPTEDLLLQNGEKMALTGEKFSYYSASVEKSLRYHIVIATEGTFKKIAKQVGHEFCAVIVDEADRVTPTFKKIIDDMREGNPLLRVLGMTGTPFRMKTGYIYGIDTDNVVLGTDEAIEPYYRKLLYRLPCNDLIAMGYLTPVSIGTTKGYDTKELKIKGDKFTDESVKMTFENKGSITETIVKDIIDKSKDRKGVMIFCASLEHCDEVVKYLPQNDYVLLRGDMPKKERRKALADFKAQRKKYLINQNIATVGVDVPHADVCVLMRGIESNRLFQQIVWRVVRLCEGKDDALLLDYGNNIENLFNGDADIFSPQIKTYGSKHAPKIEVCCPDCNTSQEFAQRHGFNNYDKFGYSTDLAGDRLQGDIPAHHGRRCKGMTMLGKNQYKRCDYYWTHKECKECGHKNDIAARKCEKCAITLINPDDKLSDTATVINTGDRNIAVVTGMEIHENDAIRLVTFRTPHGDIVAKHYTNTDNKFIAQHAIIFDRATNFGERVPKRIEYVKQKNGYFTIKRYMHS